MSVTVQERIASVVHYLREDGNKNAVQEARILVAHVLGIDRGRLTLHLQDPMSDDLGEEAIILAGLRADGRPISQIIGYRDFFGRRFHVTQDVLDPRPETETLVASALEHPFSSVLDLGTGSGAIVVSLLAENRTATAIATDISGRALEIAKRNAAEHGVAARVGFVESDWFQAVGGEFDLIVSNPPYIALDEMDGLAPELAYEPRMALTDEGDGLSAYRAITGGAMNHLMPGGRLMVEIGWRQGADVRALFEAAGFAAVTVLPDLDGRDRVVCGLKP